LHLVARLVAVGRRWSPLVAVGRRWSPSVAVGRRWSPRAPRHFAWQAWHLVTFTLILRGRRCTWSHLPAFGVAGVALVALGGALGRRCSPLVARGAAPLCMAVALGDMFLRLVWQVWHLETSTCAWRGRSGTCCIWWNAWLPLFAVGRCGTW